jgi:hypothetical protein
MDPVVIDIENPIHEQILKFFKNAADDYVLSDSVGKILIELGYINLDMTIDMVNRNVAVRGFIREKIGLSFATVAFLSIFGKEFNVADLQLFLYCSGNPNFNKHQH